MDTAAINRILEAIGRQHLPVQINVAEFGDAIDKAVGRYHLQAELTDHALWKRRAKHQANILKTAGKLAVLLKHDDGRWLTKKRLFSDFVKTDRPPKYNLAALEEFKNGLNRLIELTHPNRVHPGYSGATGSPIGNFFENGQSNFDNLVGKYLFDVYRDHVQREPGVSHTAIGTVDGPYCRFVAAVLREEGITKSNGKSYSLNTIAAALSHRRAEHKND